MKRSNDKLTHFELPRADWHDQVSIDPKTGEIIGRIYKDALIDNFNAIEKKALEIQGLDVLDISIPDPSSEIESYPDTSLEEEDNNNQIVNLKSLVSMLQINGYPIELQFSGAICTNCKYYWNKNGTEVDVVSLSNINTGANSNNKFLYLKPQEKTIVSTSTDINQQGYVFIGMFVNGRVIHTRSQLYPSTSTIKGR